MGLTLEQANLDFTARYARAFEAAGDPETAAVCRRVHDDEIGHVRVAVRWLQKLGPPGQDPLEGYRQCVPFPLGPARAKGRAFDADARRRAGLGDDFIEYVRQARSPQELRGKRA